MSGLIVRWGDLSGVARLDKAMRNLSGRQFLRVANPAVNRAGDQARTPVRRTLPRQTGLKAGVIVRAVKTTRSTPATLTYEMRAQGGDIALKYFAARETRRGVSAQPFGQRRVFPGTFMKGGRFPARVALNMGGHVFMRLTAARVPIELQNSGVIIPVEMVKGATKAAFETTVARVLPQRIAHEIRRVTGGALT